MQHLMQVQILRLTTKLILFITVQIKQFARTRRGHMSVYARKGTQAMTVDGPATTLMNASQTTLVIQMLPVLTLMGPFTVSVNLDLLEMD